MFLTRIPVPDWVGGDPNDLARSTVYFPVIGMIVGAWGAIVLWAASLVWSPFVAVSLSTLATVWLTGAFHEDALADACDGFGGGWSREQTLAIMKDSRVGSYGVVGLGLVLAIKVGALASITEQSISSAIRALVVAHTLGRWSSLPLIWKLPYVTGDGSKSRPYAASVTTLRLFAGSVLALAIVSMSFAWGQASSSTISAAAWPIAVGAVVAACLVTLIAARYFVTRIGGMTGDCLGAANQVVEVVTYLLLASSWARTAVQ